ncbi:DUF1249 domain-containing protein [Aliiglaciecola sp. CAU 1673]|uniref:DUF1249 domain-containing protein n=1 Tax=Aliiglaciecola sp. CAU 1673 TaxID=3032595 RepID=UPI0023DA3592|nr:DUF1249 domain-containing protein [Aliiglaciecola sp. CAU 1673]MDF2180383.1 DUF1249 domain-containing protein [Aliiglaciecola sp. CAU 1673]
MAERQVLKKYVPRLATLQAVCEVNYGRLIRLLPDLDHDNLEYRFGVASGLCYLIRIQLCEPYTTTLEMRQVSEGMPTYLQPVMQVRLYHDARMAEVLGFQHMGKFRASYPYPNRLMHQRNEKELVNHFLADWLVFCLQHRADNSIRQNTD